MHAGQWTHVDLSKMPRARADSRGRAVSAERVESKSVGLDRKNAELWTLGARHPGRAPTRKPTRSGPAWK